MKLLIIRHGDPDYQHDTLTQTGWREAELLSCRLAQLEIAAFYVSPLGRAQDTAAPTLQKMNRSAKTLEWRRDFPPNRMDTDIGRETPLWDWLPGTWTREPRFYDREAWMHVPVMEKAGAPEAYRQVVQGLDGLLAQHGYRRNGEIYEAEKPNRDTIVLRTAEPSVGGKPDGAVAWSLCCACLCNNPDYGGTAKGCCLLPHGLLWGYSPSLCGWGNALIFCTIL